jgi:hypothetical protein
MPRFPNINQIKIIHVTNTFLNLPLFIPKLLIYLASGLLNMSVSDEIYSGQKSTTQKTIKMSNTGSPENRG